MKLRNLRILKSKFIFLKLLIVIIFGAPIFVSAVEVANLYTGKIMVTDKSKKTRVKAHRWAIEQVIAKVSGNREVLNEKKIRQAVQNNTANYIKSFAFITDEQGRTFLVDQFDQSKIDNLLKSVGAAIWGQRRPNTIIWLAVEEGISRAIIDKDLFPQIHEFIYQSSDNRGLPITLPEMDKTDKDKVFTSDVWARFDQAVWSASNRYDADNIVLARMRYVSATKEPEYKSGWLLEYELMNANKSLIQGSFNGEQFSVLRDMINHIGDYFAAEYAITSEELGNDKIHLELRNINDVVALNKVEEIIQSLSPVSQVQLTSISNNVAEFDLELTGEGLDLVRALALMSEFEQVVKEQAIVKTQLSIEEQLDMLTQDYLAQVEQQKSNMQIDNNEQTSPLISKPINLTYNWLGQ